PDAARAGRSGNCLIPHRVDMRDFGFEAIEEQSRLSGERAPRRLDLQTVYLIAFAPARVTCSSFAAVEPLTPIAPITLPPAIIRSPPRPAIKPSNDSR